jgi:RNase P subunit RPR2
MSSFEESPRQDHLKGRCFCKKCGEGFVRIEKYLEPTIDKERAIVLGCAACSLEEIYLVPDPIPDSTLDTEQDADVLDLLNEIGVPLISYSAELKDLTECPECRKDFVIPVEWKESSDTHWEVLLRCPNCEWTEVGEFDQATIDKFDEKLDQGEEVLTRDLKRLTEANIRNDKILPKEPKKSKNSLILLMLKYKRWRESI